MFARQNYGLNIGTLYSTTQNLNPTPQPLICNLWIHFKSNEFEEI